MKMNEKIIHHLESVLDYAEKNVCLHDETYRGGTIWEICCHCGAKWADDEGGKPDDTGYSKVLAEAREFLDSLKNRSN